MPKFGEFLFGKKGKNKKLGTLTPDQEELMSLITQGLKSGEGSFGELFGNFNEKDFEKGVTQPALKNFQENILPMLQEKFIAGNQVGGSGQLRAQNKAGVDLQSQLDQLMYSAKQGQKQNQLAGLQQGLGTKGFENLYQQGSPGALQGFIKGAGQGIGQAAGAAVTGGLPLPKFSGPAGGA